MLVVVRRRGVGHVFCVFCVSVLLALRTRLSSFGVAAAPGGLVAQAIPSEAVGPDDTLKPSSSLVPTPLVRDMLMSEFLAACRGVRGRLL